MRKGQYYTVFKLLQGAIIASVMLLIVYGVIQSLHGQVPSSDPFTISAELLSSAYAAAGTGKYFTKQALLVEQSFEAESVRAKAGLPSDTEVKFVCKKPYCIDQFEMVPVTEAGSCQSIHDACTAIGFEAGDKIWICAKCVDTRRCYVFFGEKEC